MTTTRLSALFSLCATLLAPFTALAAPPPVSDFVKRPEVSRASLSEDGRYVAFLTPSQKDYYELNVHDLETKESRSFDLKGDDVMAYEWIDAHRMIINVRHRPHYYFRRQVFDVRRGEITGNLGSAGDTMAVITSPSSGVITDNPDSPADNGYFFAFISGNFGSYLAVISSLRRDPNLFSAWFFDADQSLECLAVIHLKRQPNSSPGSASFNSRYKLKERISTPKGEFHGAFPDHDGEIRVIRLYHEQEMRFYHRSTPKDSWKRLPLDFETTTILGFDDDPDYIYLAHYAAEAVTSRLHRYRVSTNELGPPLFEDSGYSLNEARLMSHRLDGGKSRIVALTYHRDIPVQRAIDPAFSEAQTAINAKLPGRINLIQSCDRELKRFVVSSETGREPPRFAIYDHIAGTLQALPAPAPWLNPAETSVMRPIKFPARDGLMLEGYLSLPAKPTGGAKPPLVVYAHTGPWARDTWGYDNTVQLLTSRGYAVFQPNYRGSTGYSKQVSKDHDFDFRKMHDDVTDGVKHLVIKGLVDEKRLAIFGRGFGGFLAVAGVAYEPDLYRCAVTFGGAFDWKRLLAQRRGNPREDNFDYEYWLKRLGDPAAHPERFERNSPINQVAAIKAAVLVAYGEQDPKVDYRQSTRLLAELDDHNVPHAKLSFPSEDHGPLERENEQKFLDAVEQFLAKHL